MGISAEHRSSLCRSFSAIHLPQPAALLTPSSDDASRSSGASKRDARGREIKNKHRKNAKGIHRRATVGATARSTPVLALMQGPTRSHTSSNPSSTTQALAVAEQTPDAIFNPCDAIVVREMPELPFPTDQDDELAKRDSSRERRPAKKFHRRNSSVTFAPLPTSIRSSILAASPPTAPAIHEPKYYEKPAPAPGAPAVIEDDHRGFRTDYSLGDTVRQTSHIVVEPSLDAEASASTLQKHDFAFVRRSDGSHSYAIVAYRSSADAEKGAHDEEEYIVFVMNETGATKKIRRRHWGQLVRRVAAEGACQ